jgi:hypothetical protein
MTTEQVIQQFQKLPEPYRTQAVKAFEKYPKSPRATKGDLCEALMHFNWYKSDNGLMYWDKIYNRAKSGEFDQPAKDVSEHGAYQPLFNYLSKEHGVNLLENELQEVIRIVNGMQQPTLSRSEVAARFMAAMLGNPFYSDKYSGNYGTSPVPSCYVKSAIELTDALINELKKQSDGN